ncbi:MULTISPECIES: hypothetical protein [unclassified Corallococcus]|uniref:hypothetical protein n=1 Tax=unclassified Corallococcus TaxID=2685029 RepID=UPI001A8E8D9A|nr:MULTISPECIES: hypothetical protein [unclassified Corallococcus]MBN9680884.1 hypothetical protein [Corallococcus sp. NCSPR001]WAS87515.1 hypothetical protein O0N60_11175 [Corallococcus sp. NCRR]
MRTALAAMGVTFGGLLSACLATAPVASAVPSEGVTPAGPFVDDARPLFEGCVPVPDSATSRTYRCGTLSVWLHEQPGLSEAQAVDAGRTRVHARLGPGLTEARGELPLGGQPHPSLRFEQCSGENTCTVGGYVTAVTPSAGHVRQLGCVVRGDLRAGLGRCLELFAYLATRGNPEGDTLSPSALVTPPRLPWRVLFVPEGCEVADSTTRAGRIRCAASTFSWSLFRPVAPGSGQVERWRDRSSEELRDALPGARPVEVRDCYVEGQATRCVRFTAPAPEGGGDVQVWTGGVDHQGWGLFAACSLPTSTASLFPTACNGVFAPR